MRIKVFFRRFFITLLILFIIGVVVLFTTSFGHRLRVVAAETILSSQHRSLAKYTFLSQQELDDILASINKPKYVNSHKNKEETAKKEEIYTDISNLLTSNPSDEELSTSERLKRLKVLMDNRDKLEELNQTLTVSIDNISETYNDHYFTGKLVTISNPHNVKLVASQGSQGANYGEQLQIMAKRNNAIAAINASGFVDPNGNGNGGTPIGIIIRDGQITSSSKGSNGKDYVAALTESGLLVTGFYTPNELIGLNTKYAAGFKPQLLVNGEKMIKSGNGGWGYGPRTALAQKKDGSIMFLVIDGRQKHSIGASMKDVQDLLFERGAHNAMAMDGGSSALMYFDGRYVTTPSSLNNVPRYIPNAWVVAPNKGQIVKVYNNGKQIQ